MSSNSPPLNPSQAVERIREIIVGRHLERLEQRVSRLESTAGPVSASAALPPRLEDRLCAHEAQLEALKEGVSRLVETTREQADVHRFQQQEEIQRLASQIQQVASQKAAAPVQPANIQQLERKIGTWLGEWQNSFQRHLNDRDQKLADQLRGEVASLWENTESQLTRLESRAIDRDSIEERFNRIALAARALAECASPSPVSGKPAR